MGNPDPASLTSISARQLSEWSNEENIEWCPHTPDINRELAKAHLIVLPSHGGEGLPKTLIDAAAAGRAVATTDVPGCRDAIIEGQTGVLFPLHDPLAIADIVEALIENPERLKVMGAAARTLAEERFNIHDVQAKHLKIYKNPICRVQ